LNTRTGEVLGQTAPRHTSEEFVAFLQNVVDTQPRGREIHYTPTYSSWLNQIELWFAKIERDVTARGIFTSVTDLRRKLMRYIRHYNTVAKPIRWSYTDPSRRIA